MATIDLMDQFSHLGEGGIRNNGTLDDEALFQPSLRTMRTDFIQVKAGDSIVYKNMNGMSSSWNILSFYTGDAQGFYVSGIAGQTTPQSGVWKAQQDGYVRLFGSFPAGDNISVTMTDLAPDVEDYLAQYNAMNYRFLPNSIPKIVAHIQEYLSNHPIADSTTLQAVIDAAFHTYMEEIQETADNYIAEAVPPAAAAAVDAAASPALQEITAKAAEAAESAREAALSEQSAEMSEENALSYRNQAQQIKDSISSEVAASVLAAQEQATLAQESAQAADESADTAELFVGQARAQAEAAADHAQTASGYASDAQGYMQDASGFAQNASDFADNAAQSAATFTTDPTLTIAGKAADAKATGDQLSDLNSAINTISAYGDNLLDLSTVTDNVRLTANGTTQTENGYYTTDFIPVIEGLTYSKNSPDLNIYHRICLYNESKSFISADNTSNTVKIPNGCKYIRFSGKADEKATAYFLLHTAYDYALRKDLPFVIPQQFGAVGDGVADDTVALQTAINSGKKVVLPRGVYLITSPLIISADAVRIEGAVNNHWNNTTGVCAVIKAGASVQSMLMIKDGICCFELENVNLHGNALAEYGIYHEYGTSYTHDHTIKNVRVSNCLTCGISFEHVYKSIFENVRAFNTNIGFSLKGYVSGQTHVFGTTISLINCYSDVCNTGFELAYLTYSSLINCASDHSAYFCYRLLACFNVGLMNCGCEGAKRVPIALFGDCRSIKIDGFSVLALDENLESNRSCIIHCENAVINMIVDGIYISTTEYPREYIINNTVTEGTSITVLDDSVKPENCLSTDNNCIAFVFKF